MSRTPSTRSFAANEWRTYRDLRLRALADSPDAFASTLALEQNRPDEEWRARLASGASSASELPLVAELRGKAVGLAWGRIEPPDSQTAHVYQMWVAPEGRGMGAGRLLLEAVIAWAKSTQVLQLDLGASCGDTPANRLYARAGFEAVGAPEPIRPGSTVLGRSLRLKLDA